MHYQMRDFSSNTKISIAAKAHHGTCTMNIQKNIYFIFDSSDLGGVSKSMLKKSRLNFDKIEKCK
ncbi:hypothetical protein [Acinetobacter sp. WCHAc010034]|uniref:hypothetical protein n=1 Tax=Acinetobacter sp. WCHAc010034 TaxID=1879049 RepID=UPI00083AB100|nr:hypothetical protein [Acinetobacter sp. WCHAc010034]